MRAKQLLSRRFLTSYIGRLALGAIIIVCAFSGFLAVADIVTDGTSLAFDQSVLTSLYDHATPFQDQFFIHTTELGSIWFVLLAIGALSLYLYLHKRWRSLIFLLTTMAGTTLLNISMKIIFARQRPALWQQFITETGYSFPSGHAMASCALGLALIVVMWRSRYRYAVICGCIPYIAMIGYSRLYLGVHYPTDIIAGWLTTIAWTTIAASVYSVRYFKNRRPTNVDGETDIS